MKNNKMSTSLLIKVALLSAMAVVLMYFDFPVLPAFPWLKIDLSDIPALIGAFAYGPFAGVIVEGMKNILILLVKPTQTGGVGEFANFIIGASLVVPAGLIYAKKKTRKNAIVALIAGTIGMAVVGALANYFIFIPMYKAFMPQLGTFEGAIEYLTYGVVPFNLIKGVLVSVVTALIYKQVAVLILRESGNTGLNSSDKKIA